MVEPPFVDRRLLAQGGKRRIGIAHVTDAARSVEDRESIVTVFRTSWAFHPSPSVARKPTRTHLVKQISAGFVMNFLRLRGPPAALRTEGSRSGP